MRQDLCGGTIRRQASSYKDKDHALSLWSLSWTCGGASLLANIRMWQGLCGGTIRRQASSYKDKDHA